MHSLNTVKGYGHFGLWAQKLFHDFTYFVSSNPRQQIEELVLIVKEKDKDIFYVLSSSIALN